MKVFIVEDDPIIVEGLDIALSQEKYEVDSFGCMKDALEVAERTYVNVNIHCWPWNRELMIILQNRFVSGS